MDVSKLTHDERWELAFSKKHTEFQPLNTLISEQTIRENPVKLIFFVDQYVFNEPNGFVEFNDFDDQYFMAPLSNGEIGKWEKNCEGWKIWVES